MRFAPPTSAATCPMTFSSKSIGPACSHPSRCARPSWIIESLSLLLGGCLEGSKSRTIEERLFCVLLHSAGHLPTLIVTESRVSQSLCTNGSRDLGDRSRTISSRPARHSSTNGYWRAFCQDCGRQSAEVTVYFSS